MGSRTVIVIALAIAGCSSAKLPVSSQTASLISAAAEATEQCVTVLADGAAAPSVKATADGVPCLDSSGVRLNIVESVKDDACDIAWIDKSWWHPGAGVVHVVADMDQPAITKACATP